MFVMDQINIFFVTVRTNVSIHDTQLRQGLDVRATTTNMNDR